jgi:hypothetical protein
VKMSNILCQTLGQCGILFIYNFELLSPEKWKISTKTDCVGVGARYFVRSA